MNQGHRAGQAVRPRRPCGSGTPYGTGIARRAIGAEREWSACSAPSPIAAGAAGSADAGRAGRAAVRDEHEGACRGVHLVDDGDLPAVSAGAAAAAVASCATLSAVAARGPARKPNPIAAVAALAAQAAASAAATTAAVAAGHADCQIRTEDVRGDRHCSAVGAWASCTAVDTRCARSSYGACRRSAERTPISAVGCLPRGSRDGITRMIGTCGAVSRDYLNLLVGTCHVLASNLVARNCQITANLKDAGNDHVIGQNLIKRAVHNHA
jgi:hypothetical protein